MSAYLQIWCSIDNLSQFQKPIVQVILAKNLDSKGTMSIATKVAIQLNCKLGGAPWALPIPVAGLMIVGYDVCHDTSNRTKSFGAMVASLDRFATRYYNIASAHANGEELSNDFSLNMVKACKEFAKNNGNQFPEKIIIYRYVFCENYLYL